MEYDAGQNDPVLLELEELTRQTFLLWKERRVGFSWRHYYHEHTLRVRANALSIGTEEGADPKAVAYASTLHDITKRYDGPIKVDSSGRRITDENGFWINEPILPAGENEVTRLYDEMQLYSTVHHESGARIAERLLEARGFPKSFREQVAHIIRGHLRPPNPPWSAGGPDDPYRDPESQALYDADTIDANLGAVAFYRNVQIHGGRAIKEQGSLDLYAYADAISQWVKRKESFVTERLTDVGREVAAQRYQIDVEIAGWLLEERQHLDLNRQYGLTGLILFFLKNHEDPCLETELKGIETQWLPERREQLASGEAPPGADEALARAEQFLAYLDDEINGRIEARPLS